MSYPAHINGRTNTEVKRPEPVKKREETRIEVLTFSREAQKVFSGGGWNRRYSAINNAGENTNIIVAEGSDFDRRVRNELVQGHTRLSIQITVFNTCNGGKITKSSTSYVCLGKG